MAFAIAKMFTDETVLDIGCGSGAYVKFLRGCGLHVVGVDGNPNTEKFCDHCYVADISMPLNYSARDWVLCLEVGEHVPKQFEAIVLDNVASIAIRGAILSWFPYDGEGIGHVNAQSNDYIKGEMAKRGFTFDAPQAEILRNAATLWWFKQSLMVFKRA